MIRRPPESTRTDTRFPTRRASDLADVLEDGPPALVAVMLANNETGVLQPVAGIAATAHAAGALLHCDAVQAAGRVGVDFAALGADLLSLSAHKIGEIGRAHV